MKDIYVVAICKNEEKNVDRFIKNVIQADKVIVLDTGSTDKTYDKLCSYQKEYKNLEVYQKFYKEFKFDEARNDALSYVDSKQRNNILIVNIDFDEYFYQDDWKDRLIQFLEETEITRGLPEEFFIDCLYKDCSDITLGNSDRIITCMRMFCGENFSYQNEVHETIVYNDSAWLSQEIYRCCKTVMIVHDQDTSKSRQTYIDLGEEELEEAKKKKAGGFVEGQIELLLIFEYNRNNDGKKATDTRLEELYSDVQKLPVDRSFANVWMYEHYNDKKYLNDLLDNLSDQYYDQNITYLLLKEVGKENIPKDKLEILIAMFEWNKEFIGQEAFALSEMDQEIEKMLYSEEKSAEK